MENNKIENKSEKCEKSVCCKYHRFVAPLVVIALLIIVFAIGFSLGHGFGNRGYRGVEGFEKGGCTGSGISNGDFKTCPKHINRNINPDQSVTGQANSGDASNATTSVSQ